MREVHLLDMRPAPVILRLSCAGLTRASINKTSFRKVMDCRFKSGNEEEESISTPNRHQTDISCACLAFSVAAARRN
jgi:hypothetical protein